MEGLEHDADPPAAKARQRILVEAGKVGAVDDDPARIGPLEPGHGHEQGRLARARGPDEAHRLAPGDIEGDSLEDMHPRSAAPETQIDIVQRDGLVLHASSPDLLEKLKLVRF